eukprot:869001-Prymnesium_polylepis.1
MEARLKAIPVLGGETAQVHAPRGSRKAPLYRCYSCRSCQCQVLSWCPRRFLRKLSTRKAR